MPALTQSRPVAGNRTTHANWRRRPVPRGRELHTINHHLPEFQQLKEVGANQQRQHQRAEQAGPSLLEAEQREFVEPAPPSEQRDVGLEPRPHFGEPGLTFAGRVHRAPIHPQSQLAASLEEREVGAPLRSSHDGHVSIC
jgi:hypothetical protein